MFGREANSLPGSFSGDHTMSEYSIESRVKAGAELLDRIRPGWHDLIDLDILEMSDCTKCVAGQIYGTYMVFVYSELSDVEQWEDGRYTEWVHGFIAEDDDPDRQEEYDLLGQAWKAAILSRRNPSD